MKELDSNRVMNGSFGEAWVDDDYLGEVEAGKAELVVTYGDISRPRHLIDGKKLKKMEGKGSLKMYHVRSNIAKRMSDALKQGRTLSVKIIMRLEDPDAYGADRVALYGCKFGKATLMDWEAGKETEDSYDFTFEDWEFLDFIIA